MNNWPVYKIENICDIKSGKRIPLGFDFVINETQHPYIRARDIKNGRINTDDLIYLDDSTFAKIKKYIIEENDIAITIVGASIGDIGFATKEVNGFNLTENAVRLTNFKDNVSSQYLFYLLVQNQYKEFMQTIAGGAAQPKLGIYKIQRIKVQLPPLPTQQKIASILSAYDNLIQNYKKQIEALQTAASELYKEWFVRFRFPGYQTTKFENGIPEGWKVERLGKLVEIKSGKRLLQGYDFSDSPTSHPYIRVRDIKHGNIDSNDFAYISDEVHKKLKRYIVDENDILLTIVANIGDVGYVNKSLQGFNLTENAVRLTHYSERIEPRYLCYYLSQPATKIYMEGLAVGAAQAKLGIYKIETIKVLLPNINIQKDFSRRIALIHTKIDNLNKQITNLTQQRDLLLPRLMSGKLEVK